MSRLENLVLQLNLAPAGAWGRSASWVHWVRQSYGGSRLSPAPAHLLRPHLTAQIYIRLMVPFLVAEHLVLKDFSFDRACRRIECEVDQSAKEDIGSLTRSDEMVDVVDREFHF